jgi:uncharacterized protein YjiK
MCSFEKYTVVITYNRSLTMFFSLILLMIFQGCDKVIHVEEPTKVLFSEGNFAYNLNTPDNIFLLPEYLKEISGLSYLTDNDQLACVQDENAIIYIFDIDSGKIVNKYQFGRDGDYEGVAINHDTVFVLRSDGTIFKVEDFRSDGRNVITITTPLSSANNTEGSFYDAQTNQLLITCKDFPGINNFDDLSGFKAVYSYDLTQNRLNLQPEWLIDLSEIEKFKNYSAYESISIRLGRQLKLIKQDLVFKPSGIAIHPHTEDAYIIAHIGKKLLVINREGRIKHLFQLDPGMFKQPEGICFSPAGDLFISNEGRGGKANIIMFTMNKTIHAE